MDLECIIYCTVLFVVVLHSCYDVKEWEVVGRGGEAEFTRVLHLRRTPICWADISGVQFPYVLDTFTKLM